MQHVYILCIAGDVVLLAFLQHIRIECGSDAGANTMRTVIMVHIQEERYL